LASPRAARPRALRSLIAQLVTEKGVTREEAYVLCSVAVELPINEAVNFSNHVVIA
jgi:acetamidase/formamidase